MRTTAARDDCRSEDSVSSTQIIWGNTQRREKCNPLMTSSIPALKIATAQLQGAMVTGFHGMGFCPWPEANKVQLSKIMTYVWGEMAQKQRATEMDRPNTIDIEPTEYEARKVLFRSALENRDANVTTDV